MSTYLVAFIICDFRSVSATTSSGVQVSIYAAPEKLEQTHYALEVAVKTLDFYEKYFNIYYPLPKQDLIAIPDFESGAMENWGLTTYRETSLLYDPLTSSAIDKLWVTMVIAHELAHQWFGNLVTMVWWNDIWLNEGFARYMEYIAVEATYPELHVEEYLLNTCFAAVGRDSLNSSRPVSSPAENPTQINEMFDTVSYDKGACVLHMLRHFLTDEVFQSGIVRYLRRFSYGNAHNQDLWDSLANYLFAGEHLNLTAMMNTWTLQKGVPLVTVTRKGSHLLLRQERFLKAVLPSDPVWATLQHGYLWHIPLTFKTSTSSTVHRHLMLTQTGRGSSRWGTALDLIGYLPLESHTTHILHFFRDVIDRQTWGDQGSVSERYLRSEVLSLACDLGHGPCLWRANQSFADWLHSKGTLSLPTDLTETIYSVGAQDDHGWEALLHAYSTSHSETQKHKILTAMASSRDTSKLSRLLELALEGEVIRNQDLSTLVYMVARNPLGQNMAWNFVKKHWGVLVQKFSLGSFCIRTLIVGTTSQFSSPEQLADKNVVWMQRNLGALRDWLNTHTH
ncbi:hypothetical protein CRUP_009213 [Coryphaenoides rupestris]|nr:hypothetical protein CRUP_009213 [Coryphaenoides rupestris]